MRAKLAIDTTSEACSVALLLDDGRLLQRYAHAPRQHGELLLCWIEALLAEAGLSGAHLDGIWVTRGPGSFTSLRLGFSVATAMAFALEIPVIAVSSLQALAMRALNSAQTPVAGAQLLEQSDTGLILATLDARLGELYACWYLHQAGCLRAAGAEHLLQPAALPWPDQIDGFKARHALGNGLLVTDAALQQQLAADGFQCHAECWPQAADLFAVAGIEQGVAAWLAELPYLRKKVADKPAIST